MKPRLSHREQLLHRFEQAFKGAPRPERFMSCPCEDCTGWHEYLADFSPGTLDLGPGPDLIGLFTQLTPDAFRYWLLGFVRIALSPGGEDLLWHLTWFELCNAFDPRLATLDREQVLAARDLVRTLRECFESPDPDARDFVRYAHVEPARLAAAVDSWNARLAEMPSPA